MKNQKLEISRRLFDIIIHLYTVKINRVSLSISLDHTKGQCRLQSNNVIFDNVIAPRFGNFFDVRRGELSFHPNPENQQINENNKWNREGRVKGKPTKLIRYILAHTEINTNNEKYINRFVELVAMAINYKQISDIKISGDIKQIYTLYTAENNVGTLGNSCMRKESSYACRFYPDFYDKIGLSVAYTQNSNNELTGRALIWKNCKDNEGNNFTFVDRIYGTENTIREFREFAIDNDYYYKIEQSYSSATLRNSDGNKLYQYYYNIDINVIHLNNLPFVDTMCFLNECDEQLQSYKDNCEKQLQNCDGNYNNTENDNITCYECSEETHEDNAHYIEGNYYCNDCVIYSEYYQEYILTRLSVYSDYHQSYMFDDECFYVKDISDYVHSDLDGEIFKYYNNAFYSIEYIKNKELELEEIL